MLPVELGLQISSRGWSLPCMKPWVQPPALKKGHLSVIMYPCQEICVQQRTTQESLSCEYLIIVAEACQARFYR